MKNVKKILSALMVTILVIAMAAGCGSNSDSSDSTSSTDESESEEFIAFASASLSNDFFVDIANNIEKQCEEAGIKYDSTSAEYDSTTQGEQIVNFATMGATKIIVIGPDVVGIADSMKQAKDAGAEVIVAGSQPADDDAYDACLLQDQEELGDMQAQKCAEWIEETFPDAEPGSIEVGIMEYVDSEDFKIRSDSLSNITNYTDKATIVQTFQIDEKVDADAGVQEATENLLTNHPDVRAILCYSCNYAVSVNEAIMRHDEIDKETFATYGCSWSDAIAKAIQDTAEGNGVVRGTIRESINQGYDLFQIAMGNYELDGKVYHAVATWAGTDNIEEQIALEH